MNKYGTVKSPYIAGNSVGGTPAFAGRVTTLREIKRMLESEYESCLLIYGQRRIGKTSVLQQLKMELSASETYLPVFWDASTRTNSPAVVTDQIVRDLAVCMVRELQLKTPVDTDNLTAETFLRRFLPTLFEKIPPDALVVLLIDEMDTLDAAASKEPAETSFFQYLSRLIQSHPQRLKFVFVIGRHPEDLSAATTPLFKDIKNSSISLFNWTETNEVIALSEANGSLAWQTGSKERVFALTGGHPLLTQQLCEMIWLKATYKDPAAVPVITVADVDQEIEATLNSASNALEWVWQGLLPGEKVVAWAIAESQAPSTSKEQLSAILARTGIRIVIHELTAAPESLAQRDLLVERADGSYAFTVELFRRWITLRKTLAYIKRELDQLQPKAETFFNVARQYYDEGDSEQATADLKRAVNLNPYHVRANALLAQIYLEQDKLQEAQKLLEALYTFDARAAQPRLIQTLCKLADLTTVEDERLQLYNRVLEIQPSDRVALEGVKIIWGRRAEQAYTEGNLQLALSYFIQSGISERAEKVSEELKQRDLVQKVREIDNLIAQERFQDAADIATQLRKDFPSESDKIPPPAKLEEMSRIPALYAEAERAIQTHKPEEAIKPLAAIIGLLPHYHDAHRLFYAAHTGRDPAATEQQLEVQKQIEIDLKKTKASQGKRNDRLVEENLTQAREIEEKDRSLIELRKKVRDYLQYFPVDPRYAAIVVCSILAWLPLLLLLLILTPVDSSCNQFYCQPIASVVIAIGVVAGWATSLYLQFVAWESEIPALDLLAEPDEYLVTPTTVSLLAPRTRLPRRPPISMVDGAFLTVDQHQFFRITGLVLATLTAYIAAWYAVANTTAATAMILVAAALILLAAAPARPIARLLKCLVMADSATGILAGTVAGVGWALNVATPEPNLLFLILWLVGGGLTFIWTRFVDRTLDSPERRRYIGGVLIFLYLCSVALVLV